MHDLTKSRISSLVKGSPNNSSLVFTYLGPVPGKYGPGNCTGLTPFLCGGGSTNESNSFRFFLLGGSGARPVHGRGVVTGPNGTNGGSRILIGLVLGVSV